MASAARRQIHNGVYLIDDKALKLLVVLCCGRVKAKGGAKMDLVRIVRLRQQRRRQARRLGVVEGPRGSRC